MLPSCRQRIALQDENNNKVEKDKSNQHNSIMVFYVAQTALVLGLLCGYLLYKLITKLMLEKPITRQEDEEIAFDHPDQI